MLFSVEMQNEIYAKRRKDGKKKDKQTSQKKGQAFLDGDALCTRVEYFIVNPLAVFEHFNYYKY